MANYQVLDMDPKEFALWQTLLEKRTGLWLPESRKAFLITALTRYLKEKGFQNFAEIYSKLNEDALSLLDWATLVDSLTVHETCYYRDVDSLKLVSQYCRELANKHFSNEPSKPMHIQVWSVGCSTGEEAYSLSIELEKLNIGLNESFQKQVYFGVTAMDISYPSLAVAREGIYAERLLDLVPETSKNLYFERLADDYYRVRPNVRQKTCFIQGNVLELDKKKHQEFDVIYCQNVLIYFRKKTKLRVVNQLIDKLKPGGMLVLGHGEIIHDDLPELTRVTNKNCLAFVKNAEHQ